MKFLIKNKGTVQCGGAATYLQKIYEKKGLNSWTLNFGFADNHLLSHVVTLVEIDNKILVQDPYFNGSFNEDVRVVIENFLKINILFISKILDLEVLLLKQIF